MQTSYMKRRALSDGALPDGRQNDWNVCDVVNRIEQNANRVPQQDRTLEYATVEQLDSQNECIGALTAQVTALSIAQHQSNGTANALVTKISSMMEAMDRSQQQLEWESKKTSR